MRFCLLVLLAVSAAVLGRAQTLPSSDLYLIKADGTGAHRVPTPKGYNNQPAFLPDGRFLFSGGYEGPTDIYLAAADGGSVTQVTYSQESEFSPTPLPDGAHFSVVRVSHDGVQRLWRFSLDGGAPELILPHVTGMGYHLWLSETRLVLFIVGEPHRLVLADIAGGPVQPLFADPGRCLARVPDSDLFSVLRQTRKGRRLVLFSRGDLLAEQSLPLWGDGQDYAWAPDGALYMGKGAALGRLAPGVRTDAWQQVADLSGAGIAQINRLAVSPDGTHLALVAPVPD